MRFSFITCTYNRAENLKKTLQSLCEQTYNPNQYEIIVVDNNSSDNTVEVCNIIKEKHFECQIHYFKEINQGLSFALNRGINEAQGEFILYIDDDETVGPKHLERLDEYLHKYRDAVLIGTQVVPIYEGSEPKWMSHFTQRLIGGYFNAGNEVKKLDKGSYPGTGHTIIKRDLYNQYGLYNTDLGRTGSSLMGAEDKDMIYRLISNDIECYYFPNIPIYHHIPKYKLTDEFFNKLTLSIGKSERIRTKGISEKAYHRRLFDEAIKWIASIILCVYYLITLRPQKGLRLILFRKNVTKGLLGKYPAQIE